jgi:hypothetical protein
LNDFHICHIFTRGSTSDDKNNISNRGNIPKDSSGRGRSQKDSSDRERIPKDIIDRGNIPKGKIPFSIDVKWGESNQR